ncbi:MAG: pyridoxal phosphate-dependent aminotransferase [Acetivibrio ethanolgignens]
MKDIHGGDIYRNQVSLDFSVNVNPLGMPEAVRTSLKEAVELCSSYPDIQAEKLKKVVSRALSVPEDYLLFGNGASELFMGLVHAIAPRKTVIPVPSFYGYEYAAEAVPGEILYYTMKKENNFLPGEELFKLLTEEVDIVFLANPNNPTGRLIGKAYLECLLNHCQDKGIWVVLDECFIEFCEEKASVLPELEKYDRLLLVRAFTKIYGIPGVRLGYLVSCNRQLLKRIERQLPEWNLSTFAQAAGCICAEQTAFVQETKAYVKKERNYLSEGLEQLGLLVFPGAADFILVYSKALLYEKLLERGILLRDCQNFRGLSSGYYRISVRKREDNDILLRTIGEIL